MKSNKFSFGLLSMVALVALSSCGTHEVVVDRTLPTDDPTSEISIKFWHCLGHNKRIELEKIVNKFNTEYDGKYEVELFHLGGDYDSLHDTNKTKLAGGEVPALTMGYPDSFAEYISKDIGQSQILRLDSFINDPNYGYSEEEIKDFVPGYYAEGTSYHYEGTWSMPMYKSTEVMYYNETYFKGGNAQNIAKFAGNSEFTTLYNRVKSTADPEQEDLDALETWVKNNGGYTYEVPTTWDELVTLSRQMIADRKAHELKDTFFPFGYDSDANLFISRFAQEGIPFTKADAEGADHFLFNNAKAKELVQDVLDLVNEKVMITKGTLGGSQYTNTYFNEGQLAMTIGSTGGSSYNISSNFKVSLAPVPYGSSQKYIQQGPSICFFNNEDDYIHKGAWLFYKMLADTENNAALALENSYDPIRISSYDTENYKNWIALKGQGLKYDIPAITATLKQYYYTSPTFVGSGTARTEIGRLLTYTYINHFSLDTAFEMAMNACIQKA